jgi:aspartyl-tRNA(Asn)/glutamyl-tRNA(Gln) amidotransferase subunit C
MSRTLALRDDVVKEGNNKIMVLKNAKVTEEEYFVAPPGNIPMEPDKVEYQEDSKKKTIVN